MFELWCMPLSVTNALAYYIIISFAAVKRFIVGRKGKMSVKEISRGL